MSKITPHLWFDHQAHEAAESYVSTFPDSKVTNVAYIRGTPSGDVDVISFELFGQAFQAISAGPLFKFNPSISFTIACDTTEEADFYWEILSEGGRVLMPIASYPFSERFGWTEDRYGLSWQVMYADDAGKKQRITPTFMFVGRVCGRAQEAINLYISALPDSSIGEMLKYGPDEAPDVEGTLKFGTFTLAGQQFAAMDSALPHDFAFNEAISMLVSCESQEEIDRYSDALSADSGAEQCGWLKDEFGVSWQIVPSVMGEMLTTGTDEQIAKVAEAFLKMKRLDIAELQRARQP